jgi:hypothetical protein
MMMAIAIGNVHSPPAWHFHIHRDAIPQLRRRRLQLQHDVQVGDSKRLLLRKMMRALFSTSSTLLNLVPSPFHRSISHFYLPILFGLFRSSFVPFKWIPFAAMQIRLFRAWLVDRNTLQVHLPKNPSKIFPY